MKSFGIKLLGIINIQAKCHGNWVNRQIFSSGSPEQMEWLTDISTIMPHCLQSKHFNSCEVGCPVKM